MVVCGNISCHSPGIRADR
ncbi:MAG: CxxxxCH/CxxCH domain-containing protein [candidate division Zixibacteria bacterium]|nr:CxxxxCH/CxxCH domain-containing protein [candidate division Zixibacteria bacterium]